MVFRLASRERPRGARWGPRRSARAANSSSSSRWRALSFVGTSTKPIPNTPAGVAAAAVAGPVASLTDAITRIIGSEKITDAGAFRKYLSQKSARLGIPNGQVLKDLTGSTDQQIFDNIKNGIAPDFNMVPFKDKLKDEEIRSIVTFIRSLDKKK